MRQGDRGDSAYIIEDGVVEIFIERADGHIQNVGTRGPGTIIGEMAIVDDAPRTATVRAVKDCKLLEITREDFSNRLKTSDPVLQMISQVILTRYRDMLTRAQILGESETYPPPEMMERDYAAQTDVMESVKIGNEFQAALQNDQIKLYYQPIVSLKTGDVVGFEALMRWIHPEKGFISPGLFIPIVEKNGMIVEASRWALREACSALKRIESRIGREENLYMSVNFSSADFASENFLDHVYTILSETDVQAKHVKLEITERLLIQQPDNAKDSLDLCRKAGMSIAIDDFGTGYSSLSYLYYFPIDTLKIDQSFVRAISKDSKSRELVKSIIDLGKNMNMNVIAEGVETIEEAKILNSIGCDSVQGYYFAKPMPELEVSDLLINWTRTKLEA